MMFCISQAPRGPTGARADVRTQASHYAYETPPLVVVAAQHLGVLTVIAGLPTSCCVQISYQRAQSRPPSGTRSATSTSVRSPRSK